MSTTCYNEHSAPRTDLFPCSEYGSSSSSGIKWCCNAGDQCGSNGFCMPAVGTGSGDISDYYIKGCTSSDWAGCPKNCFAYKYGGVQECTGNQSFCCYGDTNRGYDKGCDCNNASAVFSLSPAYPVLATIPASLSSSATSAVTTTTGASATTAATTTAGPSATTIASAAGINVLGIGLGVGLGVGIPLASVAVGGVWMWKRRQRRRRAGNSASSESSVPLHGLLARGKEGQSGREYQPVQELQSHGGDIYDYNKHRKGELDSSLAVLPPQELPAERRP